MAKRGNQPPLQRWLVVVAMFLALAACTALAQQVIAWGTPSGGQTTVPANATNAIAVAGGDTFSLALLSDNTVIAWGNGQGVTELPAGLSNVVAIAAGAAHGMALNAGGSVVCWGNNNSGQCNVPAAATNVVAIAAGSSHSLALRADGKVVAWGLNSSAQTTVPASLSNVVAVAGGGSQSMALGPDGKVTVWGGNTADLHRAAPLIWRDVVAIAASANQNLALRAEGKVSAAVAGSVPKAVSNLVAIACGENFNLALRYDGSPMVWGTTSATNIPADATNLIAIAAGRFHCLAIRGDGSPRLIAGGALQRPVPAMSGVPLYARFVGASPLTYQWLQDGAPILTTTNPFPVIPAIFGSDSSVYQVIVSNNFGMVTGQLGSVKVQRVAAWGDYIVGQVNIPASTSNVCAVSAGEFHALALTSEGTVLGWGKNSEGQASIPASLSNVVAVAAGGDHSLALLRSGSVVAWGRNADGQTNVPPNATNVVAISAGWAHNLALRADGSIVAWGNNDYSQGFVSFVANPAKAVAAGYYHSMALRPDGTVMTWGLDYETPPEATNVVAIAAGRECCLALRGDGTVVAWGDSYYGQTTIPDGVSNITSIAVGYYQSLAVRADGQVIVWGRTNHGITIVESFNLANIVTTNWLYADIGFTSVGGRKSTASGLEGRGPVRCNSPGGGNPSVRIQTPLPYAGGTYDVYVTHSDRSCSKDVVVSLVQSNCTGLPPTTAVFQAAYGDTWGYVGRMTLSPGITNVILTFTYLSGNISGPNSSLLSDGYKFVYLPPPPTGPTLAAGGRISAGEDFNLALVSTNAPVFGRALSSASSQMGGATVLSGSAIGGLPMTYQWYHDGQLVAGATDATLFLASTTGNDAGSYTLVAANAYGSTTNQPISLNVQSQPVAVSSVGGWGQNSFLQLEPTNNTLINPVAIAAGGFQGIALNGNGTVTTWGRSLQVLLRPIPPVTYVLPPVITNAIAVAAAPDHFLALGSDGSITSWGGSSNRLNFVPPNATNIVAISAGATHDLALRADGTVIAWGNNDYFQTNVPAAAQGAIAIDAGYYNNLALLPDHSVIQWGAESSVPDSATNVIAVSAGWWHNLALRANGTVLAWGNNDFGQTNVPPEATNIVAISAGWRHSLVLRGDGTVVAWGSTDLDLLKLPAGLKNVSAIAAGEDFSLALVSLGPPHLTDSSGFQVARIGETITFNSGLIGSQPMSVQWWHDGSPIPGANQGILVLPNLQPADSGTYTLTAANGFGSVSNSGTTLAVVPYPLIRNAPQSLNATIGESICVTASAFGAPPLTYQWKLNGVNLTDSARVTGANSAMLCISNAQYSDAGTLSVLVGSGSGGASATIAHLAVTPILAWGDNSLGQLAVPQAATNVIAIAAGQDHSMALRADGQVLAWGDNSVGQTLVPASATNIVAIAAGDYHCVAVRDNGGVLGWGWDPYGQTNFSLSVTNYPNSTNNIVAVAAGRAHNIALRSDGSLILWGENSFKQTVNAVPGISIAGVAANNNRNYVLTTAGQVYTWGDGSQTATQMVSLASCVTFACSPNQTLAVRTNGSLYSSGFNYYGQLNPPSNATNFATVAITDLRTGAVLGDGSAAVWGYDSYGTTNLFLSPHTNVVAVALGDAHSLALTIDPNNPLTAGHFARTITVGGKTDLAGLNFGGVPSTYQWQLNGTNIDGATNRWLSIPYVFWTNAGTYHVLVSNRFGIFNGSDTLVSVGRLPLLIDTSAANLQLTGTNIHLRVTGASGSGPAVIEASPDLVTWLPIYTNPPVVGAFDMTNTDLSGLPNLYFRVREP